MRPITSVLQLLEGIAPAAEGRSVGDFELLPLLLFLRHPPPTGTFLNAPPLVQYLRQVLQKWRGCERL